MYSAVALATWPEQSGPFCSPDCPELRARLTTVKRHRVSTCSCTACGDARWCCAGGAFVVRIGHERSPHFGTVARCRMYAGVRLGVRSLGKMYRFPLV